MPLTVVATLKAKPGREEDLFRELRALVKPTRAEQGCIAYEMHRSLEEPGTFVFTESWQDRPLWEAHMNSPHLASFGAKQDELTESWTLFVGEKVTG